MRVSNGAVPGKEPTTSPNDALGTATTTRLECSPGPSATWTGSDPVQVDVREVLRIVARPGDRVGLRRDPGRRA